MVGLKRMVVGAIDAGLLGRSQTFGEPAQKGVDDERLDQAFTAGGAQASGHVTGELQRRMVFLDHLDGSS